MILLVHSARDIAGVNIANHILKRHPFKETGKTFQEKPVYQAEVNRKQVTFITLKEEAVQAQNLPDYFPNTELIVFISRHSSQSGRPTLSVHVPGNLGDAELGGLPRQVSVAPAGAMAVAIKALNRLKSEIQLDYEVSYECTHHGPSLRVPAMFVELGSSEKQWNDLDAAGAVGEAAIEAIREFRKPDASAVLGIGGTHYNEKFTQMTLAGKVTFGHMIPKYAIPLVDSRILRHCTERTYEKVDMAILDWKGIKAEDKPKILTLVSEVGLNAQKV